MMVVYSTEPENLPPLENYILDWAAYVGLLPATVGEVAEPGSTAEPAQPVDKALVGVLPGDSHAAAPEPRENDPVASSTRTKPTQGPASEQFFNQKLAGPTAKPEDVTVPVGAKKKIHPAWWVAGAVLVALLVYLALQPAH